MARMDVRIGKPHSGQFVRTDTPRRLYEQRKHRTSPPSSGSPGGRGVPSDVSSLGNFVLLNQFPMFGRSVTESRSL